MRRIYPLNAYQLLEEARKSWDYFISDEVVYEGKVVNGQRVRGISWIDHYLMGEIWFEACAIADSGTKRTGIYLLIENCGNSRITRSKSHEGVVKACCNDAMFVRIRQQMQIPEQVEFWPLRSVVRLKAFDLSMCIGQNKLKGLVSTTFGPKVGRAITQREFDSTFLLVAELCSGSGNMQHSKVPRNVIQRVSQVGKNITDDQTPILSNGNLNIDLNQLRTALRYGLFADGVLWIEQSIDTPFQSVDVYVRPLKLQSGAIKWPHMLYSHHEGEEDAKDTQGSRDTRTKPRGLPKEPRPSGENPQETLTASTLSEPKLRTERGHRRGDYTAKHTRLGSLEDA